MNESSSFGDIRLDRRQNALLDAMVSRQSIIINELSDNRYALNTVQKRA